MTKTATKAKKSTPAKPNYAAEAQALKDKGLCVG